MQVVDPHDIAAMDIWNEEDDDRTAMQTSAERDWGRMSESFTNVSFHYAPAIGTT